VLASVSGSITSFVGDHGVYAVFLLMAIDAVFPAASELVMVYAGALASGAFASQHVVLFGHQIDSGGWAYRDDGTGRDARLPRRGSGRLVDRPEPGGRPFRRAHGRLLPPLAGAARAGRALVRPGTTAGPSPRPGITPVVRSFVSRSRPGVFRSAFWPYPLATVVGSAIWAFALAGIGYAFGSNYERFHQALTSSARGREPLLVAAVPGSSGAPHLDSTRRADIPLRRT
jgi:hypothetical protein